VARAPSQRLDGATDASSALQITPLTTLPGVYSAYLWKNVAITLWFGPPAMDDVATYERGCRARAEEFPGGVSSVHIMLPGGRALPSPEVRVELRRVIQTYSYVSAGIAIVIPGVGFWASALRGLVTALSVLGKTDIKPQICGGYAEVAAWLPEVHRERTGVQLDSGELLSVLQKAELAALALAA
jgi:hypothetical protein